MDNLTFANPVFAAYALAAAAMILLVIATAWITVLQMIRHKAGYRAPEDARRTLLNPDPQPGQVAIHEPVERYRRIMQNHLENIPFFLLAGFLFVLTGPGLETARALFFGYGLSRLLHFAAYASAQSHEVRATFWTVGSLIIIAMCAIVLSEAVTAI